MADTATPHYGFIIQQPGTNRNTWGSKLNTNWTDLDAALFGVATNAASALSLANGALQKAGDTMTGDLVLASVGPTAPDSAGLRGVPPIPIDADRTFSLNDAGRTIRLTGTTARTWTIPPVGSVGFPVGTVIVLRNFSTSASISLVRGSGVELRVAGSSTNSNKTIAPQGLVTITMEAVNVWVASGIGVS